MDGPLQFKPHVDYLVRKITPKLKTLSRIRGDVGKGTALYLFNSLIAPVFSFNEHIYDSMGVVESNRLQTLHNACLRVCLKCDCLTPRSELYEESNVAPLYINRIVNSCGIVYAGLNQLSSTFINCAYTKVSASHSQSTRASAEVKLAIPSHSLECCKGNILTRGAYYYNDVPAHIRTLPTLKMFKQNLKVHLVELKSH